MVLSYVFSMLESFILLANAVAILSDRFLSKCTYYLMNTLIPIL